MKTVPRGIGGVLATVHEITEKVVGERRVAMLRDLGARTGGGEDRRWRPARSPPRLSPIMRTDIPFAAVLPDRSERPGRQFSAGVGGVARRSAGPTTVALREDGQGCPWPLAEVARSQAAVTVEDLAARLPRIRRRAMVGPAALRRGPADPANRAGHLAGILVAGVSSRLRLDDQYRSFLDWSRGQIGNGDRQRPRLRGGAQPRRSLGRDRSGQDRLLLQRRATSSARR